MTKDNATQIAETKGPSVAELRHKAEIPMLVFAAILTIVGIAAAAWAAGRGVAVPGWAAGALVGLATPLIVGTVFIRFSYWQQISNSIEITEDQLPEVYSSYVAIAQEMEMENIPRLYLANGNGALNAFASKCQVRRTYIVIFSDLVDIAYELGDFDGINFVLAHELGHIKCGHVDLWRLSITAVPRALFIGRSVVRAQEYTADRCAAYYAPAGAKSMLALYAGKRMYRHCDLVAYRESVAKHKNGFWLRFANFWSDHAVGFRRMEPISDIKSTGWDVHGKML